MEAVNVIDIALACGADGAKLLKALDVAGFEIVQKGERFGADALTGLTDGKVGRRIAALRAEKSLSQEQLSEKLDCHWVTVSKLERNEMALTVDWLFRMAKALEVAPADLLDQPKRERVISRSQELERLRDRAGLSIDALAKEMGYSGQSSIQRYLRPGYDRGFRPEVARDFRFALRNKGIPPITDKDLMFLDDPATIAPLDIIREILERRNMKPGGLAEGAGVAPSTLTRALNNPDHKFIITTRTLNKIVEWDNANPAKA